MTPHNAANFLKTVAADTGQPPGKRRFAAQLALVANLLDAHGASDRPGLALYRGDLRTPLFRLEGLARLGRGYRNRRKFEFLLERLKIVEDALGLVDYYDAFARRAESLTNLPMVRDSFLLLREGAERALEKILRQTHWLRLGRRGPKSALLTAFIEKMEAIHWPEDAIESEYLVGYIRGYAAKLGAQVTAGEFDYTNLEDGVHELRRRLRWISIYAGALDGKVCLKPEIAIPPALIAYQTAEVLANPHNRLAENTGQIATVSISAPAFYALSWLIDRLGALKDDGQYREALQTLPEFFPGKKLRRSLEKDLAPAIAELTNGDEIAAQARAITEKFVLQDRGLQMLAESVRRI